MNLKFLNVLEAVKGEQKKFGGGTKQIADSRSKRSQEKERRGGVKEEVGG